MKDNPALLVQVRDDRYASMDEIMELNPDWTKEDIIGFVIMHSPSDYFN